MNELDEIEVSIRMEIERYIGMRIANEDKATARYVVNKLHKALDQIKKAKERINYKKVEFKLDEVKTDV